MRGDDATAFAPSLQIICICHILHPTKSDSNSFFSCHSFLSRSSIKPSADLQPMFERFIDEKRKAAEVQQREDKEASEGEERRQRRLREQAIDKKRRRELAKRKKDEAKEAEDKTNKKDKLAGDENTKKLPPPLPPASLPPPLPSASSPTSLW
jgi:hypothetical protein